MKSRPVKPVHIPAMLLVMLLSLFAFNVSAVNMMFLSKESPAAKFSDADWQYLNQAIKHALTTVEDGASYDWKNPASPASGSLEVLESTTRDGTPCRRMRMTNFYGEAKGVVEFLFCKQPDGEWKVAE
jgi:surface antigen